MSLNLSEYYDLLRSFSIKILERQFIKFEDFILYDGISSFYINFRELRSDLQLLEMAVDLLSYKLGYMKVDYIGDIPTSITPVVSLISYKNKIPMLSPRFSRKTYGMKNEIDGNFIKNKNIVVIDDVLTKGNNKLKAIEIFEKNGLKVKDILVLVDRCQGGTETLIKKGFVVHSLLNIYILLSFYYENKMISLGMFKEITNYLKMERENEA